MYLFTNYILLVKCIVLIFIQGFCLLYKHESNIHLHFSREIKFHIIAGFFYTMGLLLIIKPIVR